MKLPLKVALVFMGALSMFSCSDDEIENQAPSVPVVSFPAQNAADVLTDVTLKWKASTDPEKGAVKYDVYIGTSEKLTDADIKSNDQMAVEYKATLTGHTQYFWKVVAKDDAGAIAECIVSSFITANSIPTISTCSFPLDKSENVDRVVNFKWSASTDGDKDAVVYFLYVSEKDVFTKDDIKGSELAMNEFALKLKGHTKYFWQVVTKDSEGGRAESTVFSFTTENLAPSKPVFKTPTGTLNDIEPSLSFSWDASTDGDGDELTYSVYISEKSDFSTLAYKNEGLSILEWNDVKVKYATKYYFKLVVKDAFGGVAESDINSFTTKENDYSDEGKINVIPSTDEALVTTFKWKPCRGEGVKYTVYFGTKESLSDADIVAQSIDKTEYTCSSFDAKTTYYWKVVASGGVSVEGDVNSFTTGKFGMFVDIRDNHAYKTINIDGVIWMAENLAYLPYFVNDTQDEKKCSVYGKPIVGGFGVSDFVMPTIEDVKASENYIKYGVMYSAYMLEDLAPAGWHVATDEDWKTLEKLSGMSDSDADLTGYRGSTLHKFLSTTSTWANNPAPTDEFGLDIKPGGYNKVLEETGEGAYTYFWTNTYVESTYGNKYWNRAFSGTKTGVNRGNTKSSTNRMYVRLVKDSE